LKKAVFSVINDVVTDNRIHKMAITLMDMGFDITIIGRKLKNSLPINRPYRVIRMKLLFNKKVFFYAAFNIRLFFKLLFIKTDILVSNDLDTLLPNYLISKIKKKPLVYDSHEFFTEVPELVNRKIIRKVWLTIEKAIFPKLNNIITVNSSIAKEYKLRYNKDLVVVRNISNKQKIDKIKSRQELELPIDKKIIVLQGAGININRGAEEMVTAMQYIENAVFLILGNGDVLPELKKIANNLKIKDKIFFFGKREYNEMMQFTMNCDLGITLDKLDNKNYLFSLPNKLFDYIQAGIPILSSPVVEVKNIIETYKIGEIVNSHKPEIIAETINNIFNSKDKTNQWKENLKKAAIELCWENEKNIVINLYSVFL